MSEGMNKLNCEVGDLAITIDCRIPENMGNIVKIISPDGFGEWEGHAEPLFTWNVEIATEGKVLHYRLKDGTIGKFNAGPAPDKYLRRLTPPKGYLMDEFMDSEQLQLNLYEQDLVPETQIS